MWSRIQPWLTRTVFLPLWATVSHSSYLAYYRRYWHEQWDTLSDIENRQRDRLKQLLQHAYRTTDFYRRRFDAAGFSPDSFKRLEDLSRLPILTKADVRENFNSMISQGYPSNQLVHNATGGSTGEPMTFYVTKDRELRQAATIALNYEWAGLRLGDRLAMLWGAPFETSKYQSLRGKLENFLLGRMFQSSFVLSDEIFEDFLQRLKRFRPKVLLGYTSSLLALAGYMERRRVAPPRLTSLISGAETLYDHDRQRLEKVFSCPVFNRYGGRDSGAVAAECPERHRLHINTNVVYVETDSNGQLLITDLWNEGMPFIRYAPEDIGQISREPCPCGRPSPWLSRLEGRVHDLILKPNGEAVAGEFFPHLFKDVRSVRQFQVIQERLDELLVRIVKDDSRFNVKDIDYVMQHIHDFFGPIKVRIEYVKEIPRLPSGKFRFTISKLRELR